MQEQRVKALLLKYQGEGDLKARDKVVEAHLYLVKWWTGKYRVPQRSILSRDDIFQIGCEGLMSACDYYNPEHEVGTNFRSLATHKIRNQIWQATVGRERFKGRKEAERRMASLSAGMSWGDDKEEDAIFRFDAARPENCQYNWTSLEAPDPASEDIVTDLAQKVRDTARVILSEKEYTIYLLHLERGLTLQEAGAQLGFTRQRAGYISKRVKEKLRGHIEREL